MGIDSLFQFKTWALLLVFAMGMGSSRIIKKTQLWVDRMTAAQERRMAQVDSIFNDDFTFNPTPTPAPLSPLKASIPGYRFPASQTMKRAIARIERKKLHHARLAKIHKKKPTRMIASTSKKFKVVAIKRTYSADNRFK